MKLGSSEECENVGGGVELTVTVYKEWYQSNQSKNKHEEHFSCGNNAAGTCEHAKLTF